MATRFDYCFSAVLLLGLLAIAFKLDDGPTLPADRLDGSDIYVIDGDTVALSCVSWPCKSEHIRILDIDAPEIHEPSCDAEAKAGNAAKERLAALLRGKSVEIKRTAHDQYGRTLAHLTIDGKNVGQTLLTEGFALPMRSGFVTKEVRKKYWCGEKLSGKTNGRTGT